MTNNKEKEVKAYIDLAIELLVVNLTAQVKQEFGVDIQPGTILTRFINKYGV